MTNAIVAEALTKRFGPVTAVDGVDLQVKEGTVFGLLGPNGAGKTTTVHILATLVTPDAGRATIAAVAAAPVRQTGNAPLGQHAPLTFREGSRPSTMIANDSIIAKDFRTYKRIILRQDKILRDHVPTRPIRWSPRDVSAAR
jgi:ABC-type branched-subunit amino acid transport system ATPase component